MIHELRIYTLWPGKDPEFLKLAEERAMEIRGDRYLLLWGDNSPALGPDHLAFALAVDGDELGLYAPDGTTMDLITYGQQASDVPLARVPDGTGVWELRPAATPGAANGGGG